MKIHIEHLSLGDWLLFDDRPCKINFLSDREIGTDIQFISLPASCYQYVRLTKSVLEANGFTTEDDDFYTNTIYEGRQREYLVTYSLGAKKMIIKIINNANGKSRNAFASYEIRYLHEYRRALILSHLYVIAEHLLVTKPETETES